MTAPFVKPTTAEKFAAALPVLIAARRLVVLGQVFPLAAILDAAGGSLAAWWAREILLGVVPNVTLQAWQADPSVKRSDRTRAMDRAICVARRSEPRRGGWRVTGGGR